MFKKLSIFVLIISILGMSYGLGQSPIINNTDDINKDIIENETDFGPESLSNLNFGFCNKGLENLTKSLNVATEQGKNYELCLFRENTSNYDLELNYNFTEAVINAQGDKTCVNNDNFSKHIIDFSGASSFLLPAKNHIIKNHTLNFPLGIDGEKDGCVVYRISTNRKTEGIAVRVRSTNFIDFFVGQAEDIKNIIKIKNINKTKDNNGNLIINFIVNNDGNVEDKINIKGSVTNIFGFKKDFEIEAHTIVANNLKKIEANLGQLPSYKGLFSINMELVGIPYFEYDISNSSIDPNILEPISVKVKTTFFEMPRLLLGALLLIIILLILALRKPKQKIVYVKE